MRSSKSIMPRRPRKNSPMSLRLKQIADLIGARMTGEEETLISGVSSFDEAGPKDLTFAGDPRFLSKLEKTCAGAVLVPADYTATDCDPANLLFSANPKLDFFRVVDLMFPRPVLVEGIHPSAVIGEETSMGPGCRIEANVVLGRHVSLGRGVHIMANAVIGDQAVLGDGCVIKPNVTIMDQTRMGSEVIVHSGAVIGSDGYGFTQDGNTHAKQVHTGRVEIGDRVEIGACTCIDRGTLGVTRIGNGVKIDNQVHIAHNVKIGDNTLVVAQVGIAGSTRVGKGVILAGRAGLTGHITIGDNAIVGPYAGVSASVPPNDIVSGIPHMPHKTWLKISQIIPRLPGMRKQLLSLEKRFNLLESKTKPSE